MRGGRRQKGLNPARAPSPAIMPKLRLQQPPLQDFAVVNKPAASRGRCFLGASFMF